jgi:hypothetical protein
VGVIEVDMLNNKKTKNELISDNSGMEGEMHTHTKREKG